MEALRVGQRTALRQLLRTRPVHQPSPHQQFFPRLHIQPTFRSRPGQNTQSRLVHNALKRPLSTRLTSRRPSTRRCESTDSKLDSTPESQLSLTQRLKKMSRDYGWTALYVYLGLTALDFPFCFLAVKLLGTDLIGHWEHVIVSNIKALLQWPIGGTVQEQIGDAAQKAAENVGAAPEQGKRLLEESAEEAYAVDDHGYKEAEKANTGADASIWTQLALAYAIHKSFIFVRVPLTAAILPKVVKTLRGWGWNIGPKRKAKAVAGAKSVGVNTKGSGVKPDD